jgi:glutamate racemase
MAGHPPQSSSPARSTGARPLIGVFDSGVGGLSVLRALLLQRPGLSARYIADSGHAPYGDREAAHVIERSTRIVDHLVEQGAELIIVACNTATAWAIDGLRLRHPQIRVVGVEPGIKPAVQASARQRIGVMATPATLASARFAALLERHAAGCEVQAIACTGLAAAIERDSADGAAEIALLLDRYCATLQRAGVDTVVLGCTHYAFIAESIASRLGPQVQIMDTASAVARHALSGLVSAQSGDCRPAEARIRLQSTGPWAVLARLAQRELGLDGAVERLLI